ncbi:unnamed protein product [Protopolystoma xenopodis]|uniref:Uncharacterized protein n=1 Tax=Protopolystoma xenopodis TaxID=117903 RepID=A0A3S5AKP5_9PLAT|nr:unnamed protein product [Protopolystoma xenopodis]
MIVHFGIPHAGPKLNGKNCLKLLLAAHASTGLQMEPERLGSRVKPDLWLLGTRPQRWVRAKLLRVLTDLLQVAI